MRNSYSYYAEKLNDSGISYEEFHKIVAESITEDLTTSNDFIVKVTYEPESFIRPNFSPYRNYGQYYDTYVKWTDRITVISHEEAVHGQIPTYKTTKGEDTTVRIWKAILDYKEYSLLADLFIDCFMNDIFIQEYNQAPKHISLREASMFKMQAADNLIKNSYGTHQHNCKKIIKKDRRLAVFPVFTNTPLQWPLYCIRHLGNTCQQTPLRLCMSGNPVED